MTCRVDLPEPLCAALRAAGAAAYPHETCGFLLGIRHDAVLEVRALRASANVAPTPRTSLELEPLELVRAEAAAHAAGLALLGLWHSHPDRPAEPSAEDRAGLAGTGLQLILEVRAGRAGALRAWELAAEGPRELELSCDAPDAAGTSDTRACRAGRR